MSKVRSLSDNEIYQEVCEDALVDASLKSLIFAAIDECTELALELHIAVLKGQIISSVKKLKTRLIDCDEEWEHA